MANEIDVFTLCMTHAHVDRWLRTQIARALNESDLTMMEWLLLSSVQKNKTEGLTVSQMAKLLGVTLPQVTALTQQLLKKELLKQVVESQDRRSRRLYVSPAGEKLCDQAQRQIEEAMQAPNKLPLLDNYRQIMSALVEA